MFTIICQPAFKSGDVWIDTSQAGVSPGNDLLHRRSKLRLPGNLRERIQTCSGCLLCTWAELPGASAAPRRPILGACGEDCCLVGSSPGRPRSNHALSRKLPQVHKYMVGTHFHLPQVHKYMFGTHFHRVRKYRQMEKRKTSTSAVFLIAWQGHLMFPNFSISWYLIFFHVVSWCSYFALGICWRMYVCHASGS